MHPQNLHVIDSLDLFRPLSPFSQGTTVHATNGMYVREAEKVVPTMLAGFECITDHMRTENHHVFLIAMNSDQSLRNHGQEPDPREDQHDRAKKVGVPLALQHPDKTVAVVFFDEQTPKLLFDTMKHYVRADLASIHKIGEYGTDKFDAPIIVGNEYFDRAFAFPMPNGEKPLAHDTTPKPVVYGFHTDQKDVDVIAITQTRQAASSHSGHISLSGLGNLSNFFPGVPPQIPVLQEASKSYITETGKLLFPVKHESLQKYVQSGEAAASYASPAIPRQP